MIIVACVLFTHHYTLKNSNLIFENFNKKLGVAN